VNLVGFCLEQGGQMAVVYDYTSKESLSDNLYGILPLSRFCSLTSAVFLLWKFNFFYITALICYDDKQKQKKIIPSFKKRTQMFERKY
jgi:hypothetical protein